MFNISKLIKCNLKNQKQTEMNLTIYLAGGITTGEKSK